MLRWPTRSDQAGFSVSVPKRSENRLRTIPPEHRLRLADWRDRKQPSREDSPPARPEAEAVRFDSPSREPQRRSGHHRSESVLATDHSIARLEVFEGNRFDLCEAVATIPSAAVRIHRWKLWSSDARPDSDSAVPGRSVFRHSQCSVSQAS